MRANYPSVPRWALNTAFTLLAAEKPLGLRGEKRIAESGMWSYMYATMILKGEFKQGEEAIRSNEKYSVRYDRFLNRIE